MATTTHASKVEMDRSEMRKPLNTVLSMPFFFFKLEENFLWALVSATQQ